MIDSCILLDWISYNHRPFDYLSAVLGMNSVWQAYLRKHHAVIENNRVIHFGDITSELQDTQATTIMADLSHFDLIRFSGNDTKSFLQSQLSCDIREINLHAAQYGCYCTPKGRILTNFLLCQQDDDLLMQLPIDLSASVQKRLSMYVLRAKVQLAKASDDWVRIGIAGSNAITLIQNITGCTFDFNQSLQVIQHEHTCYICLSRQQVELIAPIKSAFSLWEHLSQHTKPVGASWWDWLNIQSGIPVILPETQEMFLPQMVNLDVIGGVSFKKGCYPGQEIVARTRYLGKLKRRMYLAHIATTETIKVGDALFSHDMDDQSIGNIVNVASSPHGGFDILAVIQQSSIGTCEIHWQSPQGPLLDIKSLPYSLPL